MLIALWIAAILLLSFLLLNALYKRTNFYKSGIAEVQKFVSGVPMQLEIVNTGSSYGSYGISYDNCGIKGFNFAVTPQSLEYDFKILKNYANHLAPDCVVVVVLACPFVFFLDKYPDSSNIKYYNFLPKELINGYSGTKKLTRKILPVLSAKLNFLRIIKDIKEMPFHDNSIPQTEMMVNKQAESRLGGWLQQFGLTDLNVSRISADNRKSMEITTSLVKEILDFCGSNKLRPVIVVPPITENLLALLDDEFIEVGFYENLHKCVDEKIPIFDYFRDERFENKELYVNADFLNANGRMKFSEVLFKDLFDIGYME